MKRGFIDLVIGGPDMSGTSTQIEDIIEHFGLKKNNQIVKDLRGTETDALFHAETFEKYNKNHLSLDKFMGDGNVLGRDKTEFLISAYTLLNEGGANMDLKVASVVKNEACTHINPNSADVWIMEEPTKRGAGQTNRVIEQNRSKFGSEINPKAAAETHSIYRTEEFLRFRGPLREAGKIIIRSRSEESACYQMHDKEALPNGISQDYYLSLEGHKIAFKNPPTNIFVVCGPEDWTTKDYVALKRERTDTNRREDDYEANAKYQVLVNKRYASDWLEELYKTGCKLHGGNVPEITRFNIYDSKHKIKTQMIKKLSEISGLAQ